MSYEEIDCPSWPPRHWYGVPERMRGGITRYIERGIMPGDFLTAVISNDLREACARADDENRHLLFEYVAVLYNCAPGGSWGSRENFVTWLKRGGMKGKEITDVVEA